MKLFIWMMRHLLRKLYKVEVQGLEHLENAGERVLIVANHTSLLDAVLLTLFLPGNFAFAINTAYAAKWYMRPFRNVIRLFPVDHTDPMAMKGLIGHVREGNRVVIFPEGRITATGSLMKIYHGPGMVADKSDATVLPVRIDGAQYTPFSRLKGQVRRRWFPEIRLVVLPPRKLEFSEAASPRERRQEAGKQLADLMTEMVFETTPHDRRLLDALAEAEHVHGADRTVLEDVERNPLSYRDLFTRIFILGDLLKGHCHGSSVGVLMPNMASTLVTFFGLQSRGFVPAMLNYTMGAKGAVSAVETAAIRSVVTSRRFVEAAGLQEMIDALEQKVKIVWLEELRSQATTGLKLRAWFAARNPSATVNRRLKGVSSSDPAVVLFTSGSEGVPKGVVLSHHNILSNIAQIAARMDFNASDISLNALPLFHSFGLTAAALLPLFHGMKVFLYPSPLHYRVIPEVSYDINATLLFGTNVFLAGYAKHAHPYDFYSVRYVIAGAEKLQDETRRVWAEKFGVRIFEGYGATETSPVLAVNTPMHFRAGSVGRLLPGIESRIEPVPGITDGGRLSVRGPNIMAGYMLHDRPGELQPPVDGWYDTGDIVEFDDEGFVHIRGRAKRFAKVAGEMVSLAAVEEMAAECWPENAHAALAVPDAGKGEQVVLLTTMSEPDRKELALFARKRGINELQVPRRLLSVADIPLLGTGKVHYAGAQALAEKMLGAQA